MIIGSDFVWLHFPKCGGVSVEHALKKLLSDRDDVHFDPIDPSNVIWHQSIGQRRIYDPSFSIDGREVICCIRRLPNWLLSRVHFEAERLPGHVATHEMLRRGEFYERNGKTNTADVYARMYSMPRVDRWVRVEHMVEDLAAALDLDPEAVRATMKKENVTKTAYNKDIDFWFNASELTRLYEANPKWAAIERQVYGATLAE